MNNVLTIEEIFSGRLLYVPSYQRGYAWEDRQLSEFLEDLEFLGDDKEHYTGTLVLHKEDQSTAIMDKEGKSYTPCNVVDGQQRLTTVVLLLDAISREIAQIEKFKSLAGGIRKNYVFSEDLNGQPLYKLTLNTDTHPFYAKNIVTENQSPEGPSIASHKRLLSAKDKFNLFLNQKRQTLDSEYGSWLLKLHRKLTQQLKLSLYTVSDASDVGVIFEVMNDRGKPLSELEKVKNYLLYLSSKLELSGHDIAKDINNVWSNVFERLMRADLSRSIDEDQILRAHWLTAYDYNAKSWQGSKTIKDHFRLRDYQGRHKRLLGDLKKYVSSLGDASLVYCEAMRPTLTDSFIAFAQTPSLRNEAIHMSKKLRRTKIIAPFLPLLIATRLRFPNNPKKYADIVTLSEKFAFRVYLFMEKRADAGQATLYRLGYQLYHNELSFEKVLQAMRGTISSYCSSHDFKTNFELDDVESDWYSWSRGLKYFLYEYEENLANEKGEDIVLSWDALEERKLEETIEHVLPQTPRDEYWMKRFDRKARKRFTHDLGNLSLTHQNSSYKNKPFPDKRGKVNADHPCYANSSLFMERSLCSFREWNEKSIIRRRKEIMKWALQRWHVDEPKDGIELDDSGNNDDLAD